MGWALRPSGVPAAISARSMSPVAMCGIPKCERSMLAWVPLPLPGAPYRSRFTVGPPHPAEPAARVGPASPASADLRLVSSDEAAVLAHHQLRLQLFHRVERYADHDEYGCASEVHRLSVDARDAGRGDRKADRDEAQEGRAGERHAIHYRGEIVRGRTSRADARDEAGIAFEVVGDFVHVKRDSRVEVREAEREREVKRVVGDRHRQV